MAVSYSIATNRPQHIMIVNSCRCLWKHASLIWTVVSSTCPPAVSLPWNKKLNHSTWGMRVIIHCPSRSRQKEFQLSTETLLRIRLPPPSLFLSFFVFGTCPWQAHIKSDQSRGQMTPSDQNLTGKNKKNHFQFLIIELWPMKFCFSPRLGTFCHCNSSLTARFKTQHHLVYTINHYRSSKCKTTTPFLSHIQEPFIKTLPLD